MTEFTRWQERKEFCREVQSPLDSIDWSPGNEDALPEAVETIQDAMQNIGSERLLQLSEVMIEFASSEEERRALWHRPAGQTGLDGYEKLTFQLPTHTKHLVGGTVSGGEISPYNDNPYGYKLWIHKWREEPTGRYADRPHNHRYHIGAVLLAGAYDMRLWRCTDADLRPRDVWHPTREEWRSTMTEQRVTAGNSWAMSSLDIHAITALGTPISLVVQGPRQRTKSFIFKERNGKIAGLFPDGHERAEIRYADRRRGHEPYLTDA